MTSTHAQPALDRDALSRLDSAGIQYYGRSFGDPLARLFWSSGELFFGLLSPYGQRFSTIRQNAVVQNLIAEGYLFEFTESSIDNGEFESVFRLNCTPRIVFWHEWSPAMLQTATQRMVELLARLAQGGLTLRNPHPWNLLFDGRLFSFANAGSIVPVDPETFGRSFEKVARFFVRPLLLVAHGFEHIAQRLAQDVREGAKLEDVCHLDCGWAEWDSQNPETEIQAFLGRLLEQIGNLNSQGASSRWIDYFATDCDFRPGTSWTRKQEAVLSLLADRSIESVLDLGANSGHYARLAAQSGRETIAADFDPALVDKLYRETLDHGGHLYPVVLDFTHPTPGEGVAGRWFPPAADRLRADLLLCFALEHHLVFGKYRLDFEQIALGIRGFTKSWALVEYVDRGKIQPAEWRPDADSWYSVEEFASTLRRHFSSVEVLPPASDRRRLLLCGPYRRHL